MKLNPTVQDFLDYREHNPCTERHHQHRIIGKSSLLYTDGVKLLAEAAQCYWLLDIILSYQHELKDQDFQTWEFDGKEVNCSDGNNGGLVTQAISYSDFPKELLPIRLWFTDGVLLLPQEY